MNALALAWWGVAAFVLSGYLLDMPGLRWLNKPWSRLAQDDVQEDTRITQIDAALQRVHLTGERLLDDLKARGQWPDTWRIVVRPQIGEGRTSYIQRRVLLPATIRVPDFDALMAVAHEAVHVQQGERMGVYRYAFESSIALTILGFVGMAGAWQGHRPIIATMLAAIGWVALGYQIQAAINSEAEAIMEQSAVLRAWLPTTPLTPDEQALLLAEADALSCADIRWYPGHQLGKYILPSGMLFVTLIAMLAFSKI